MRVTLEPYQKPLQKWLPGARFDTRPGALRQADGLVRWRGAGATVNYLVEVKTNLAPLDVAVLAHQLGRLAERAPNGPKWRVLLLAPFVRREQAEVLRRHGIDYLDLAGNAHLEIPGRFVHVEGLRPPPDAVAHPARRTRGWVKTVMALLVEPHLVAGPYRPLGQAAGVAVGTVTLCFADLRARGFLRGEGEERRLLNLPELLGLWGQAYIEVLRPRLAERRLQMRAADKADRWRRLNQALARRGVRWALTGADAAEIQVQHFHTEDTELYAPIATFEDRDLLRELEGQPALRGNLRVIEPPGPLALPRQDAMGEGIPCAPELLMYAELRYRGTDQAQEAIDLLLPRILRHAQA